MMRSMLAGMLLLFAVSIIRADGFPPKGFTEVRREKSPREDFQIVYVRKEPNEIMSDSQIWLQSPGPGLKTQLLSNYEDGARCLVSDDERFIAVNLHAMAGLDYLEILVRNEDGFFRMKEVDLLELALKMMSKQLKLKNLDNMRDFDHIHCSADGWLQDGLVLCELSGNAGHSYFTWYFIYDAKKNAFLWDLSRINRRYQLAH